MNSQIFPNPSTTSSNHARSYILPFWCSPACQWLVMVLMAFTVILFPEKPAWGGEIENATNPVLIGEVTCGEICNLASTWTMNRQEMRIDQIQVNYSPSPSAADHQVLASSKDVASKVGILEDKQLPYFPIAYD
jgi:Na+-translocating ferredoxin:NAD+ oxidoreductase RnfD subunit